MNIALAVLVVFLVLVIVVLLAFKSPKVGVDPIDNWKQLHKMLSVQLSAIAGVLVSAIPSLEQLHDSLPQVEAIQSLHALTSSAPYQVFTGCLTFAVIIARAWRQGALQKPQ